MAELFKNLASTTLSGDIDNTTTSVGVASAMGFTTGDFPNPHGQRDYEGHGRERHNLHCRARPGRNSRCLTHEHHGGVPHPDGRGLDAHDQNDLASYDRIASRPAAGTPGRIFLPTDGLFLERDNGSTWEKFGPIWPMTPPVAAISQLG